MVPKQLIISLSLSLLYCCGGGDDSIKQRIRPVKLFKVESSSYLNRDYAGMAVAETSSELAFRVSGVLIDLPVDEGQSISEGELVARLDPRDFEYRVDAARSAMATAKSQLDRSKRLLSHEAISRQEYELSQTRYVESKSTYDNANSSLQDTWLRAPFSGNIERLYLNNYQRANAGEPVMRLVSPITMKVRFTMPESSLPLLSESNKLFEVTFDNYPDVIFPAYLKEYVPTSSTAMGVPVSIMLNDQRVKDGEYIITPGMSCSVNMEVQEQGHEGSIFVPLNSIYSPERGDPSVWIFESDSVVRRQIVVLGELMGNSMVEVVSGLESGEQIVSAGVYSLTEGERVRVLK